MGSKVQFFRRIFKSIMDMLKAQSQVETMGPEYGPLTLGSFFTPTIYLIYTFKVARIPLPWLRPHAGAHTSNLRQEVMYNNLVAGHSGRFSAAVSFLLGPGSKP